MKRNRDVFQGDSSERGTNMIDQWKQLKYNPPISSQETSSKGFSNTNSLLRCKDCGFRHRPGPCIRMTGACYNYGQRGHIARDCKQRPKDNSKNKEKQYTAGGRVFTLSADKSTVGMVSGTLSIDSRDAYVLFDTGDTHSIVSENLEENLKSYEQSTEFPLHITTPMGSSVCIFGQFPNCPLFIGDRIREVNLIPMKMDHFDIILGMDWFSKHRVTIDCKAKQIIFGDVNEPEYVFQGVSPEKGTRVISEVNVKAMVWQGCEGFLASLQDTEEMNFQEFLRKGKLNLQLILFRELHLSQRLRIVWLRSK
ncbi:uncharacterized protein LOC112501870 [Cynara cardunculus var. scolymus]|uniref:uncharacterized protein LOC112501870 n=1 Tax=Cynara cardunculus var. scolymus TaxID=59895 RepID=UPI000D625300|nr:uncharacterized protein LOC112501870 [Cynara cardunculus var. scolymus]